MQTDRDSRKHIDVCRGNDKTALNSSHVDILHEYIDKTPFKQSEHTPSSPYLKETLVQGVLCDVQHLGAVHTAIVIHLLDDQPV